MKKFLLGLIATVFLGLFSAQAQEEKAQQRAGQTLLRFCKFD